MAADWIGRLFLSEHWLFIGIKCLRHAGQRPGRGCLMPVATALYLFGVQGPFTAVGAQLGDVQASGLEYHREHVSGTPALRILLRCRQHLTLQSPAHPPVVEDDHMHRQLCPDLGHGLPVRWAHSPPHISFDDITETTHRNSPSSPLVVKVVGIERHYLYCQRGP